MGYTSYWTHKSKTNTKVFASRMERLAVLVQKIVDKSDVDVVYEYNKPNTPPNITPSLIRFNGIDEEGHETFFVSASSLSEFSFCKTARKPYDELVVACLFAMQTIWPKTIFNWSSDGAGDSYGNYNPYVDHEIFVGYELFCKATKYDGPNLIVAMCEANGDHKAAKLVSQGKITAENSSAPYEEPASV